MADTVSEQIAALSDEDWAIREEAATLLGGLKDARAVLPLTKALRDPDRAVREAAVGALSALGAVSVPALSGCLTDPALQVQEAASAILASLADARVLMPLMQALGSRDWIVRMHAAKGLGRIGDAQAIPALMPLLQDKVKAVREEASSALASIGAAAVAGLVEALQHEDWLVRLHAVEALGKLKSPDAVDPLLRALFNERDSAIREDVVKALGTIRDVRAVDYLVVAMKEPGLRLLAVEALGHIGDRRVVPLLRRVVEGGVLQRWVGGDVVLHPGVAGSGKFLASAQASAAVQAGDAGEGQRNARVAGRVRQRRTLRRREMPGQLQQRELLVDGKRTPHARWQRRGHVVMRVRTVRKSQRVPIFVQQHGQEIDPALGLRARFGNPFVGVGGREEFNVVCRRGVDEPAVAGGVGVEGDGG